jgi:phosphoribosyl-ATP pyrophosphohydrolase
MANGNAVLSDLMRVIEDRRAKRPAGSYTSQLFDGGIDAMGAKLCEEVYELIDAARLAGESREAVVHEAADAVYHLLVLLADCNVSFSQVEAELARRFGVSGLVEKAARQSR